MRLKAHQSSVICQFLTGGIAHCEGCVLTLLNDPSVPVSSFLLEDGCLTKGMTFLLVLFLFFCSVRLFVCLLYPRGDIFFAGFPFSVVDDVCVLFYAASRQHASAIIV